MSALGRFQDGFIAALEAGGAAGEMLPPSVERVARQAGFAVYRNTVMKGWVDALEANFPAVARLVGEEWFRAAASTFASAHPPMSPSMVGYGHGFAEFLAGFEPAEPLPYLPEVAALDWMWVESSTAPAAPVLDAGPIAEMPEARLGAARLSLHPATRFVWLGTTAPSIWLDARGLEPEKAELRFEQRGEGVLVTRLSSSSSAVRISEGAIRFLGSVARGSDLRAAAIAAVEVEPQLDLSALMSMLLVRRAFAGSFHAPFQRTNP